MTRTNRIRLLVCLVSLLKAVFDGATWESRKWEFFSSIPKLEHGSPQRRRYDEMRKHLVQVITYNIRQLVTHCFSSNSPLHECFVHHKDGFFASFSIFSKLNTEIGRFLEGEGAELPRWEQSTGHFRGSRGQFKIVFSHMGPASNATFGVPGSGVPQTRDCDTEKHRRQMDTLSLAFAGRKVEDVDKNIPLPVVETWEYYEGSLTPTWRFAEPQHTDTVPYEEGPLLSSLCGYVFADGERMYQCETCSVGPLSVLCAACFDSSGHEGHSVSVSIARVGALERSMRAPFCDCGDTSTWLGPIQCKLHCALEA